LLLADVAGRAGDVIAGTDPTATASRPTVRSLFTAGCTAALTAWDQSRGREGGGS